MRIGLVLLLLMNGRLFAQPAGAPVPAVPADQKADLYAIYSTVLGRPALSHPDTNRIYVIRDITGTAYSQEPADCIGVPSEYQSRFGELLEDFAKRRNQKYRLERALSIARDYELLDDAGIARFLKERERDAAPQEDRFAGAVDVITLGNVYFDRQRTLALVVMNSFCGNLCGFQSWRIFERRDKDTWVERPWVHCYTIS